MRSKLAGWLALVVAPCASAAGMATIWQSELALGGVHVGDSRQAVIAKLGEPLSEDSPKANKFPVMRYASTQVTLGEGGDGVISVTSTSQAACTPHRVCPGSSFEAAKQVYAAIHERPQSDGRRRAWFGSPQSCRLEFVVEGDVVREISVGCVPWDARAD